jgi:hypothetical protein
MGSEPASGGLGQDVVTLDKVWGVQAHGAGRGEGGS